MTGIFSYANRDLEPVIDTAQLREALDEPTGHAVLGRCVTCDAIHSTLYAAARELLTIREAGALIITPEDGEWPEWALRAVATFGDVDNGPLDGLFRRKANRAIDALRDAMPPEDSE